AMGLIYWWARLASFAPGLVNFFSQTPGISNIVKSLGGVAQQRNMPKFAPQTFKEWFRKRRVRNEGAPQVMLWPDTFNNHFHPRIAKAAVEVLEHAGYQVVIPEVSLCCGRPLYDFGMLDTARHLLHQILETLRPHIVAGIPVIGLEPSCVSVFRDEMINLSPQNTLVFVTRLDTAAPVPGARVSIVVPDGKAVWTGMTGADGIAIAPQTRLRDPRKWSDFAFIVMAEKDGDAGYAGSDW